MIQLIYKSSIFEQRPSLRHSSPQWTAVVHVIVLWYWWVLESWERSKWGTWPITACSMLGETTEKTHCILFILWPLRGWQEANISWRNETMHCWHPCVNIHREFLKLKTLPKAGADTWSQAFCSMYTEQQHSAHEIWQVNDLLSWR